MKFLKVFLSTLIFIAVAGIAIYFIGTKLIADQVIDQVAMELNDSGQLESIKQEIKKDPQLQAIIEEGKDVDSSTLPFHTKEEAVRVLMKKFSINEIKEFQSKAQSNLTADEKQQLFKEIESKLTDEELLALKVLVYRELEQQ